VRAGAVGGDRDGQTASIRQHHDFHAFPGLGDTDPVAAASLAEGPVDNALVETKSFALLDELVRIKNRGSGTPTIAEYRYDGLGQRNGWRYDINASGTVDSSDPWVWFVHDDRWRQVASFLGSDSTPKERFVHHNAGLDGLGASSYIDSVILTDRNQKNGTTDTPWADAADTTCETRTYLLQNWRADTSVVMNSVGAVIQRIKYSPYGKPEYLAGIQDFNKDGLLDFTDYDDFISAFEDGEPSADVDGDGFITFTDADIFQTAFEDTTIANGGREIRKLWAGYEGRVENGTQLYFIRNRVFEATLGVWTMRDYLKYIDGPNLYQIARGQVITKADPTGDRAATSGGDNTNNNGPQEQPTRPPPSSRDEYNNPKTGCGARSRGRDYGHQWIEFWDPSSGDSGGYVGVGFWPWVETNDVPMSKRGWKPGRQYSPDGGDYPNTDDDLGPSPNPNGTTCIKANDPETGSWSDDDWDFELNPTAPGFGPGGRETEVDRLLPDGTKVKDASCDDIRKCLRSYRTSRTYDIVTYNCRNFAREISRACGLHRGSRVPPAVRRTPQNDHPAPHTPGA